MTPGKQRAQRLALYLCSIHILPVAPHISFRQWAVDLQTQYGHLEPEQRRLARIEGRRLLRENGSLDEAAAALPVPMLQKPSFVPRIPQNAGATGTPTGNLRCPSCRMRGGRHKRLWPSLAKAEEVRGLQHDRDTLNAYACPVMPGYWHLGHFRPRSRSSSAVNGALADCPSTPAAPTEGGPR